MTDLNKLRRLAGVPVDLSKVENARTTIVTPKRIPFSSTLIEAAKVPQHRGELAPKNKKNMRQRVSCAKKALEALELARDELMSLPAIDYMEDIPDVIRQLHQMLHGEDGTGGLHHLHRQYERQYNDMEFPEDLENTEPGMDGNPTEEELHAKEKAASQRKKENERKKLKEGEQAVDKMLNGKNALANSVKGQGGIVDQMDGEGSNTADATAEQEENFFGMSLGSKTHTRRPNLSSGGHPNDKIKPDAVAAAKEADITKPKSNNPFGGKSEEEEQWGVHHTGENTNKSVEELRHELSAARKAGDTKRIRQKEFAIRAKTGWGSVEQEEKAHKPEWLLKAELAAEEKEKKDEEDCATSMPMVGEGKKPKWLEKAEVKAEKKEGKKVSKKEEKKVGVKEAAVGITSRPLFSAEKNKEWVKPGSDLDKKFAADADLNKNPSAHMATEEEPVNVAKGKQGNLFYPKATHDEGPNQMQTNPYNESQKVHVPTTIKAALKAEADAAQKNADMFLSRKDLDSKNFYEDMAKAFTELHMRLDEGTLYSMKQAQILMTSMMSIFTNKIPPDVVKFIAAGGTVRPLKDYFKQVQGNFDEWHIHPSK